MSFLHPENEQPREIGPPGAELIAAERLVDLDTGSTIAWPADQPIERQVRRP